MTKLIMRGGAVLLFVSQSTICRAKESERIVVDQATTSIDACYHWAGEAGDQSDERNKQISEGIARDCSEAQRKALETYKLYPKNAALAAKILELIDVGYFPVTPPEKKQICRTALPIFKQEFLKTHRRDALFEDECSELASTLYGK